MQQHLPLSQLSALPPPQVSSDAGSYEISLDGGMATNYMLNLVNGTLLINKATLTATAEDQTITYGDAFTNPLHSLTLDL